MWHHLYCSHKPFKMKERTEPIYTIDLYNRPHRTDDLCGLSSSCTLNSGGDNEALWELSGPQITHRKEHKCYSKVLTSHPAHKMGNRWIRFLQQYTNIFHLRAYNLPVEVVCSLCIQSGLLLLSRWERPNSTKDPSLETKPSVSKYLAKDAILCPKHEIRGRLWSESPM